MKYTTKILLYLFAFCSLNTVFAVNVPRQSLNFTSSLESPITTLTTETLDKGEWALSQRTECYRSVPLSETALIQSPEAESQTEYLLNYFMVMYGVTNHLIVGVSPTLMHGSTIRGSVMTDQSPSLRVHNLGDIDGIGDTNVFGLWRVLDQDNSAFGLSLALTSGFSAPTGKTNAKTNMGELFATADQPGAGAFAPFGGLVFSKKDGRLLLSSNVLYTHYAPGSQATTLGSVFDYNVAAVYELFQKTRAKKISYSIDGVLELNGEYMAHDTISGIKDPNSGGNIINVSPGIRVNIAETISTYLNINLPIAQQWNGTQSNSRYYVYGGVDLSF